ncbi:hypothetical protein PG995_015977 [Apiospora arundinis]
MSLQDLDSLHRGNLEDAIGRIIATEVALETYAQIIDGLPLAHVAQNRYQHRLYDEHPVRTHVNLCAGAEETARSMRDTFDLTMLSFDSEVLQSYQDSIPASPSFKIRLLELVAVALHQVAVHLFQKGDRIHDQHHSPEGDGSISSVTSWEPSPKPYFRYEVRPTLFAHPAFVTHEQYPNGIADMVGYWAEDRILGGVLLLDRNNNESADGMELPNVYFQSSRPARTHYIYQLTDDQQNSLLDYLLSTPSDKNPPHCPLPLCYTEDNYVTVDPEFAIVDAKVYRDAWERPPPKLARQVLGGRDVDDRRGAGDEELERLRRLGFL